MDKFRKIAEAVRTVIWLLVEDENPGNVGEELVRLGVDNTTDGFWIYFVETDAEWYSPKFRSVLGFENEFDFPNIPESWQRQIVPEYLPDTLKKFGLFLSDPDKNSYVEEVEYYKKDGSIVRLFCEGHIAKYKDGKPNIVLGTHTMVNTTI